MPIGRKKKGKCKDSNMHARNERRAAKRSTVRATVARLVVPHPPTWVEATRGRTAASAERARTRAESSKAVADVERKDVRKGERDRRRAIKVLYEQLGCPDEKDWGGQNGTAADIAGRLMLDARVVKRTLASLLAKGEAWESPRKPLAGRKRKLTEVECEVCADMLEQGVGLSQTTYNINELRASYGRPPVGKETVRRNMLSQVHGMRTKTATKKTGKKDVESAWAIARLAQSKQYKEQLGRTMRVSRGRGATSGLDLEAIGWWDEKHAKAVLGPMSKHQWSFPKKDGRVCAPDDGGQYTAPPERTLPKFEQEARFAFGVMMKTVDGGRRMMGVKMEPFEYTGKKMLGVAAWEKALEVEFARVEKLTGGVWANVGSGVGPDGEYIEGGRYYAAHGDAWLEKVEKTLKLVCVTRLIDHIVAEMDKAFAGTPYANTYVIAHDALSQFTEFGAQEYLRSKGFGPDRLLGPRDGTNVGTRYENRQVGDSPELMPLDSNLFSDLMYGCKQHRALTWLLPNDDPKKFKFGTPAEVSNTLRRTWEVFPTPERIVEDIKRFPDALDKIIAAKGAYVDEMDNRKGRRKRATRKFTAHPDCDEAREANVAKYRQMLDEAQ
mmetsp:Transcript_18727/g.59328  ORF Transcript_18727/g.59328 Transcript_18727/m.59328 type:complete len:610 (+) Transcript_18727:209-2038(+)